MMNGNPNEWAIAFFGVGDPSAFVVPKIANEGLRIGTANVYTGKVCVRTGDVI